MGDSQSTYVTSRPPSKASPSLRADCPSTHPLAPCWNCSSSTLLRASFDHSKALLRAPFGPPSNLLGTRFGPPFSKTTNRINSINSFKGNHLWQESPAPPTPKAPFYAPSAPTPTAQPQPT